MAQGEMIQITAVLRRAETCCSRRQQLVGVIEGTGQSTDVVRIGSAGIIVESTFWGHGPDI